jgi:hypothetical protein
LDEGTNVGRYGDEEGLVLGGVVWDEAEPQLANKAYLIHQSVGRGQLIAFAEDPNYRAYAEATELLFINAVLLGPGRGVARPRLVRRTHRGDLKGAV